MISLASTPRVLVDRFPGLARLSRTRDALAVLEGLPGTSREEHATVRARTGSFFGAIEARPETLGEYFACVRRDRSTTRKWNTGISVATAPHLLGRRVRGLAEVVLFGGNRGNIAHLHFDHDCTHSLLVQVFGRKRVLVLPPEAAPILDPVLHFSRISIGKLSPRARAALVRRARGASFVIGPGDALHLPPLHWHFVEYLDDALSISLRLVRPRWLDTIQRIHFDTRLQAVVAGALRERRDGPCRRALRTLAAVPFGTDPMETYRRVDAAIGDLYAICCPGGRLSGDPIDESRAVREFIARAGLYA